MRKTILFVGICLFLTLGPALAARPSVSPKKDSAFSTPSKKDLQIAELIIRITAAITSNSLDSTLLDASFKNLSASEHFKPFFEWAKSLQLISLTSSSADIAKQCHLDEVPARLTPIRVKLDRLAQRFCHFRFLSALENEISSPSNAELTEKLTYLEQNIGVFLEDPLINQFSQFLKKVGTNQKAYSQLSELISAYYLTSDKIPAPSILSIIEISSAITRYVQTRAPFSVHTDAIFTAELAGLADDLIRNLREESPTARTIAERTENLFAFYRKNEMRFIPDLTENVFTRLGLEFTQNRHYEFSRRAYSVALSLSSSSSDKNDNLFGLLWIPIVQKRYDLTIAEASNLKLMDNYSELDPRLQFWIAFSLQENGQRNLARLYYETIIRGTPLSYYAIMSGKKLNELTGSAESTSSLPRSIQTEFKNPSSGLLPKEYWSAEFSSGLIRLSCWASLGNQNLIDLETSELLGLNKDATLNPEFAKTMDEKTVKEKKIFLLADVLAQNRNYISGFSILQAGLSGREIIPSENMLKAMFPLPQYVHTIGKIAIDIDPVVILSLIRQESAFNPEARSPAGARGLMQIMPQTAKLLTKKIKKNDLFRPDTNIRLGISYFKGLLKKYDGNLVYSLMAYNAGEHRVAKWIKYDVLSSHSILYTIESIPYKETQNYVKLILRNLYFYKYLVNGEGVDDAVIGKIFDVTLAPAKTH